MGQRLIFHRQLSTERLMAWINGFSNRFFRQEGVLLPLAVRFRPVDRPLPLTSYSSNPLTDDEKQPNAGSQRANTVYLALEQRVERLGVINECLNCLSSIYATKYCNKKKRKRFHSKGPHKSIKNDGDITKRWIALFTCFIRRAMHLELHYGAGYQTNEFPSEKQSVFELPRVLCVIENRNITIPQRHLDGQVGSVIDDTQIQLGGQAGTINPTTEIWSESRSSVQSDAIQQFGSGSST
ncbi:hypothetical protein DINM_006138 [Dirofilaria immitis]|nr:hypothetical protein [Dirofilaria immitis]